MNEREEKKQNTKPTPLNFEEPFRDLGFSLVTKPIHSIYWCVMRQHGKFHTVRHYRPVFSIISIPFILYMLS
jgi:hypothetical protein